MTLKSTLLILLLAISFSTFSQSTWTVGTITLANGRTLEGEINDREWTSAFSEVEFRFEGQQATTYSINDVVRFATNRPALYEVHEVSYDADDQATRNLPYGRDPQNIVHEKMFLDVLVNAPIGLLHMKKGSRDHFFLKDGKSVEELLNRSYQNPNTNASALTYPKYRQQLILITNGCPDIQANLMNLRYDEKALRSVVTNINECRGNSTNALWDGEARERKPSDAGLAVTSFFTSSFALNFYESKATRPNIGIGLYLEIYSEKKPNRISFYNELVYKKIYPQEGVLDQNKQPAEMECTKLKLINALRFSFPNKKLGRFYCGIGLDNGIRRNTTVGGISNDNGRDISSGFEIGMMGMIGQTLAFSESFKINAELRYEYEFDPKASHSFDNFGLCLQFKLN